MSATATAAERLRTFADCYLLWIDSNEARQQMSGDIAAVLAELARQTERAEKAERRVAEGLRYAARRAEDAALKLVREAEAIEAERSRYLANARENRHGAEALRAFAISLKNEAFDGKP